MKFKNFLVLAGIFIGALIVWASTLLWIPSISNFLLERSGNCPTLDYTACANTISTYGATGDIFGAVTSLFSGLALFAVAFTLWIDIQTRREGRKPLVITHLNSDSLVLDSPNITSGREITLKIEIEVRNQTSEAAINISLSGILKNGSESLTLPLNHLEAPLNGGATGTIKISHKLHGSHLQSFLSSLTEETQHIELEIETHYQSLEDVKWMTSAIYEIRCTQAGQRRKLNAVRADTDDFNELWINDAAVALEPSVKGGSWKHKKL